MTAAGDWDIVGPSGTDAELVLASAAGDRDAFAGIYDRYADRLHDFCCGILHDRDGAADCVQDVFCIAAVRMTQLREPAKLRPWLYAIARTEALRRIRERKRETVSDELPDAVSQEPGPEMLAARTELAELVDEAAGGLSDRDRSVLELTYRHGLDGADLADALGVSQNSANVIVHRLRETVERALGALLVSRGVRHRPDRCAELAEILDGWDGTFTVLMRKRVARHIERCAICDAGASTTGQPGGSARRRPGVHPRAELASRPHARRDRTRLVERPTRQRPHRRHTTHVQLEAAGRPVRRRVGGGAGADTVLATAAHDHRDHAGGDQPYRAASARHAGQAGQEQSADADTTARSCLAPPTRPKPVVQTPPAHHHLSPRPTGRHRRRPAATQDCRG